MKSDAATDGRFVVNAARNRRKVARLSSAFASSFTGADTGNSIFSSIVGVMCKEAERNRTDSACLRTGRCCRERKREALGRADCRLLQDAEMPTIPQSSPELHLAGPQRLAARYPARFDWPPSSDPHGPVRRFIRKSGPRNEGSAICSQLQRLVGTVALALASAISRPKFQPNLDELGIPLGPRRDRHRIAIRRTRLCCMLLAPSASIGTHAMYSFARLARGTHDGVRT